MENIAHSWPKRDVGSGYLLVDSWIDDIIDENDAHTLEGGIDEFWGFEGTFSL